MEQNKEKIERADRECAVLVAVVRDGQDLRQTEEYLDELEFLAETAGILGEVHAVKGFLHGLGGFRFGAQM